MQARLEPGDDVGVHAIADHRRVLGVRLDRVQRRSHHQRVGLPDVVGLDTRGPAHQGRHAAGGGQRTVRGGADVVGVGGDEARARHDQADRPGDPLEAVRARLAEDHIVGFAIGERVADVVQRRRQTDLADNERGPSGTLLLQELRGRERRGPDRLLGHVQAARVQAGRQVAPGVHRVVREHEERRPELGQPREEGGRSGDGVVLVDEHAIHVHQPRADLASARSLGVLRSLRHGATVVARSATLAARPEDGSGAPQAALDRSEQSMSRVSLERECA